MANETKGGKKGGKVLIVAVLAVVVCLVVAVVVMAITEGSSSSTGRGGPYGSAAASSDGIPCAQIAVDIMAAGGTAADAGIAGALCSGVVNPHSMGIGGGFLLTYYNKTEGKAYTINARETAPANATENMFEGNADLSVKGGLAIAVPGEVRGYKLLYDRFGGGVAWSDLFEPVIDLAENGFTIGWHLGNALRSRRDDILDEPTLHMFVDDNTGDVYQEGDTLRLPELAATLRVLQSEPDALYSGSLAPFLLEDLEELGSIITEQDLLDYEPELSETPITVHIENGNLTMYSIAPPGSGVVLGFILNVLDGYFFDSSSISAENEVLTHQRITEAFKYGYGFRTQLGDQSYVDMTEIIANMTSEDYAEYIRSILLENSTNQDPEYYGAYTVGPEDYGTSHLSVLSSDGDAVSITGTINTYFGAKVASNYTGIVFNNEMDDFSSPNITNYFNIPPSPANFIAPGKRPLSSMCPAIFVSDSGDVVLVNGAAGGTKITSATAFNFMHNVWFEKDIVTSTDERRIHHQLYPMSLQYEENFKQSIVTGLEMIGHNTSQFSEGGSVISAVCREEDGFIYAASDFRKTGEVDGY